MSGAMLVGGVPLPVRLAKACRPEGREIGNQHNLYNSFQLGREIDISSTHTS